MTYKRLTGRLQFVYKVKRSYKAFVRWCRNLCAHSGLKPDTAIGIIKLVRWFRDLSYSLFDRTSGTSNNRKTDTQILPTSDCYVPEAEVNPGILNGS